MYLPEFLNLGAGFSKYFRALPALDEDLRRAVFRIRHAVYCEELGYEARASRWHGIGRIRRQAVALPAEERRIAANSSAACA